MTTRITSAALLGLAEALIRTPAGAEGDAIRLRAAVSAAYYAVFHDLVGAATARSCGVESDREPDRDALGRSYGHGEMRTVCRWVSLVAKGQNAPGRLSALLRPAPPELVLLAEKFVDLQAARHDADYDHSAVLNRKDATDAIDDARKALECLGRLHGDRVLNNFLVLLLGARKLAAR